MTEEAKMIHMAKHGYFRRAVSFGITREQFAKMQEKEKE